MDTYSDNNWMVPLLIATQCLEIGMTVNIFLSLNYTTINGEITL